MRSQNVLNISKIYVYNDYKINLCLSFVYKYNFLCLWTNEIFQVNYISDCCNNIKILSYKLVSLDMTLSNLYTFDNVLKTGRYIIILCFILYR